MSLGIWKSDRKWSEYHRWKKQEKGRSIYKGKRNELRRNKNEDQVPYPLSFLKGIRRILAVILILPPISSRNPPPKPTFQLCPKYPSLTAFKKKQKHHPLNTALTP
jgi:hypothetical protein